MSCHFDKVSAKKKTFFFQEIQCSIQIYTKENEKKRRNKEYRPATEIKKNKNAIANDYMYVVVCILYIF